MVLTLSEKANNPTQSFYTINLSNRDTLIDTIIAPDNFSTSPYYQAFTLSVGTAVSLTASVVMNIPAGEYHYTAFESPTEYNLNITNLHILERGLAMVTGTSTPFISFTGGDSFTFSAFENY